MTTETETDIGDTRLDLTYAPPDYFIYNHQQGHDVYWYQWHVEFSAETDPPHTLFTTGS